MSLWEFTSVMNFWVAAHDTGNGGMTEEDKDELWDWLSAKTDVPLRLH